MSTGVSHRSFEFGVEPEEGERGAGHVEARAVLAHVRVDRLDAGLAQQLCDAAVDDEHLLVLERAEAVQDRHDPCARDLDALGHLVEQARDEQLGQSVGGGDVGLVDTGFAVDAEPDRHATLGHREQRLLGAGQGAAGERDTERAGALVREPRHAGHTGQVIARLGRRRGDAEHGEVAGDAAALVLLGRGGAEDVVGHGDGLARDALGSQSLLRGVEVQHIAGVVAVREEHPAATVRRRRDRVDLLRRGRREQVAHRRAMREALADQTAERGVVPRAAAHHDGDLTLGHDGAAHHATRDPAHVAPVGRDEPGDHLVGEVGRVVPESRHENSTHEFSYRARDA